GDWAKLTSAVTQAADSDKVFLLKLGESSASAIATGTDTTQGALNALLGQAILALIFALLGAGAGYWGISRRLREYR
ncbi:MAG TPA: hypothetical protein VK903_05525, partial [Propionicimonas sp.]|nr:hypothetical protein [Propionicimonas sp.]